MAEKFINAWRTYCRMLIFLNFFFQNCLGDLLLRLVKFDLSLLKNIALEMRFTFANILLLCRKANLFSSVISAFKIRFLFKNTAFASLHLSSNHGARGLFLR